MWQKYNTELSDRTSIGSNHCTLIFFYQKKCLVTNINMLIKVRVTQLIHSHFVGVDMPKNTKIDFIYLSEQEMIKAGVADIPRYIGDRRLIAMATYLGGDYQTCRVK